MMRQSAHSIVDQTLSNARKTTVNIELGTTTDFLSFDTNDVFVNDDDQRCDRDNWKNISPQLENNTGQEQETDDRLFDELFSAFFARTCLVKDERAASSDSSDVRWVSTNETELWQVLRLDRRTTRFAHHRTANTRLILCLLHFCQWRKLFEWQSWQWSTRKARAIRSDWSFARTNSTWSVRFHMKLQGRSAVWCVFWSVAGTTLTGQRSTNSSSSNDKLISCWKVFLHTLWNLLQIGRRTNKDEKRIFHASSYQLFRLRTNV